MDNKIIAIAAVVVLLVAGAGAYLVLNNDTDTAQSTQSDKYSVAVNGIVATESTVADGQYNVFKRNLVLCTNGEPTGNAKCFIDWINSSEGQEIVGQEFVMIDDSKMVSNPAAPDRNGKTTLVVGGSTSIQDTMMKLADAYRQKYDYMVIEVQGGGSGVGASNTINGTFDIGMCSRDLKSSEIDKGLIPQVIGVDGVAVIVNNAGVKNLTTEQIAKIYSGEITNWKQVGGNDKAIAALAREDGSGTRECFETGLNGAVSGWTMKSDVNKLGSTGGIINAVNNTDGAIGYISIGMLPSFEKLVGSYAVAVNGIVATESTVADGQYNVFKRNLVLCTNGEPTGNAKCFIDWINSSEGQEIVGQEFVMIDDSKMVSNPAAPDRNGKTTLVVGGSTSIQDTMMKLADAYRQKYDYMVIEVQGGGSGVGASNTINGTFDIGMCSRDLKSSEIDKGLIPQVIGVDGVAVIVNNAGVKNLTTEQIAKIYSGEITNWKQVGGNDKAIAALAREDGSGTRECFETGLNGAVSGWTMKSDVNKLGSTGGIINAVNNTDGAIGYISVGMLGSL